MDEPLFLGIEPALAGQTIERKYAKVTVQATYDNQGRLTGARSTGKIGRENYSATLVIAYEPLVGSYSNSYGDSVRWENGVESSSGSYGTWEQSDEETIDFAPWVARTLRSMSF